MVILLAAMFVSACGGESARSRPAASPSTTSPATSVSQPAATTPDCAKPATKAQQLVCEDPKLIELDRRVQAAYQQALARPGTDRATLITAQNVFATTRDGCAEFVETQTCVLEAYQTRLVELTIDDPVTIAPPVVTYNCPPDAGTLTAQFYNQLDPKTVVLDWKGVHVILFLQRSGSGARYGRQGSDYWEHQGEVTLVLGGTKFICHTQ